MNESTKQFLSACLKHGIKRVSIGVNEPAIKSCSGWPFSYRYSVFADKKTKEGWPAVWRAAEESGVYGGCGNNGQAQLKNGHELEAGSYYYAKNKWRVKL